LLDVADGEWLLYHPSHYQGEIKIQNSVIVDSQEMNYHCCAVSAREERRRSDIY
jgi:hypothetical protein